MLCLAQLDKNTMVRKREAASMESCPPKKRGRKPKPQSTLHYPVGWWLIRRFDSVPFNGKVTARKLPEADDDDRRIWYSVSFTDGDSEDLTLDEVEEGIRAFRETADFYLARRDAPDL